VAKAGEIGATEAMPTAPYFKIKPASGGFRAYFYGANNELVWWTEVYTEYKTAEQAVAFAQRNAGNALLIR
jgi:uncharacterized protein YegP (UPF0339 family)